MRMLVLMVVSPARLLFMVISGLLVLWAAAFATAGVLFCWLAAAQACWSSQPAEHRQMMVLYISLWSLIIPSSIQALCSSKCTAFPGCLLEAAEEAQKTSGQFST